MLLKIIKRLENKHTLFCVCRNTWLGTNNSGRKILLHRYLTKNHLVPTNLLLSDLVLDAKRDINDRLFWDVLRLNSARNSMNTFIRVIVYSK